MSGRLDTIPNIEYGWYNNLYLDSFEELEQRIYRIEYTRRMKSDTVWGG